MKKKIVLLTLLLLLCFTEKVFAADITVVVGDKELSQKGTVIAGQVMVPAYEVAGYLGIGASYEENILWISINDNFIAKMQGNIYSLAVPGQYGQWTDFTSNGVLQYINDIVFIPVDAASVMLDADFNYNSTENEIIVKSRKVKTPSVVYTVSGTVLVTVDGKKLPQNGVIVNGRTMVPIRDIAEAIGLNVIFDNRTGRVELVKDNLFIGDMVSDSYSIAEWKPNKEGQYERDVHYYDSDVPMQNINGKMMVPLKVISEMLNADINWNAKNRVASITQKGIIGSVVESKDVVITVNGSQISNRGAFVNGVCMVPLDEVAKALKATVKYDSGTGTANLYVNGANFASVNGAVCNRLDILVDDTFGIKIGEKWNSFTANTPMQEIDGVRMVPVKMIAYMFKAEVHWDSYNHTATIESRGLYEAGAGEATEIIDMMPMMKEYVKSTELEDFGFEVIALQVERDKNGYGWHVECRFKNKTDKPKAATLYLLVVDKATGNVVEATSGLYKEDWSAESGGLWGERFSNFDPSQHYIKMIAKH